MKKRILWDYVFILLMVSISGWVISYDSIMENRLYWDNARNFLPFRDNLQALNNFGEIAWWFPHVGVGCPAYYGSILGSFNCAGPIFVTLGFCCWLFRWLGVYINEYFVIYVYYTSYLVPLVLTVSAYVFSRQLFSSKPVLYLIVILTAFSPGVVLNVSDAGVCEVAAYSLFFFAAYLNFFKKQSVRNYYYLLLATMVIALTINFSFILWNVIVMPLFVVLVPVMNFKHYPKFIAGLKTIPYFNYILGVILITIALIPCFGTFFQGREIVRSSIGSGTYALENIRAGNPFEFLSVSIPGFGFEWIDVNSQNFWTYLPFGNQHLSITYLGIISLPLAVLGLIYGSRLIRIPLLLMLLIASTIVVLGSVSPIMSLFLSVDSPLRSNKHFSDLFFRSGGYLLIIFAAGAGLNALLRSSRKIRLCFMVILGCSIFFGVVLHLYYLRSQFSYNVVFDTFLVISFFFMILGMNHYLATRRQMAFMYLILFLTIIDLSTFTSININRFKTNKEKNFYLISELPALNNVGMVNNVPGTYAGTIIINKHLQELQVAGFYPVLRMPIFSIYSSVHVNDSIPKEIAQYDQNKNTQSLCVAENDAVKPEFSRFLRKSGATTENLPVSWNLWIVKRSYNTLELKVNASAPAVLLWRDEYSPYWKAWLDGQRIYIARAFFDFKAVTVPAGESTLLFKFEPPYIGSFLLIAYLAMAGIAAGLIIRRDRTTNADSCAMR
jgi:hypothetical protein